MGAIEFTDNVQDLSTDQGFQFKFLCERCGDGYMSSFQTNVVGLMGSLLRGAGHIFGGAIGRVSWGSYDVQRAVGGAAHNAALRKAVTEIRPLFLKCRRCGDWMCVEVCWNAGRSLCKRCAPVADEEEAAVRAGQAQTEAITDVMLEEEQRRAAKEKEVLASCPDCGVATLGKKFCPGCGRRLSAATGFCVACKAKLTPGAKFCGECGAAVG